jgi:propanol-preferring alcohol dehydrogenase
MKAAVLCAYKQPIEIMEVPAPVPGPDEVLIKVEACGVCHSDLHLAEGDWPQLAKVIKLPLILGHEVIGRVVEQGNAVQGTRIGERVGVPWIHWSCGECEFCVEGRENLCIAQSITGATVDGGFADFMKAKASHALRIQDSLGSDEAAPVFCAGVTVYRAIKNAGVGQGQRVAVFGIGGLGHLAVQIARTFGARVIAVDIAAEKLELARSLGAEWALNAATENIPKQVRALGGAHFALVTSASKKAYDAALPCLRRGGTLVIVGVPAEDLTVTPIVMVGGEYKIFASAVGTRQDLREVLELAASGQVRCRVETRPLDQVNQVFDAMRAGKITGRIVLTP